MDAEVRVEELVSPLMPAICAKTGGAVTATRVARFIHVPRWVWFSIPLWCLGIPLIIMAVLAETVTTRAEITFPVSEAVMMSRKRRMVIAWTVGLGGPAACIGLGFATHLRVVFASIALATLFVGVCVGLTVRPWLSGRLYGDGRLRLRKVAPEWVAAHKALVQQQRAFYAQQALYYQQAVSYQEAAGAQQQTGFDAAGGYYTQSAPPPPTYH